MTTSAPSQKSYSPGCRLSRTVSLNMLSHHLLGFPAHEFVKPNLGCPDKRVERRIIKRFGDPVAMLDPEVLLHGEGFLPLFDDWEEWHHPQAPSHVAQVGWISGL
jgi:hypothetical protein